MNDVRGNQHYSATKARQGEVVPQTRWQKLSFIAGPAGMVVLLLAIWSSFL